MNDVTKLTKEEMRFHSAGIAGEMGADPIAKLIASNGLYGDARVEVWEMNGFFQVANTNGEPVWREAVDAEEWDELVKEIYVRNH